MAMEQVFQAIPMPTVLSIQAGGSSSFFVHGLQGVQFRPSPYFDVSAVAIRRVGSKADRHFLTRHDI